MIPKELCQFGILWEFNCEGLCQNLDSKFCHDFGVSGGHSVVPRFKVDETMNLMIDLLISLNFKSFSGGLP